MGAITRGYKNAFRNRVRSVSVILILSISIGMSLIMLMSLKAVQNKIDSVKSNIGNTITVSPAGIRGPEGGGDLLVADDVSKIAQIDGVTKTVETLTDHLSSTNTSLQPSQEAGSFGRRQQGENQTGSSSSSAAGETTHAFQMPVMVTATNDLSVTTNLNVSSFTVKSGETFDASTSDNVAMVGTELAAKNNLSAGSTFQAYGKDIKVAGIFDGGNAFANAQVFMPIKTLQNLSGQENQINSVLVQTSSIDKMDSVQAKLKEQFGDKADIVSSQDSAKQAVTPLENIRSISLYGLIGSMVAGAVILFLTMLMIVRERRREIGILKAIGSSNAMVTAQFAVESLVLTLMGSVIGIIVGTLLSNPILKVLVSNNTQSEPAGAGGHAMMMRVGAGIAAGAQGALRNLTATVGMDIIGYGILAAVVVAILGSVIPSFIISKVSPAEVLRSE